MILEGSQYFLPSLSTASIRIVRAGLAEGLGEGVAANDLFMPGVQSSVAKIVKAMADWVRMTKLLYLRFSEGTLSTLFLQGKCFASVRASVGCAVRKI